VPDYKASSEAFKSLGIDEIIVFCVNDGAVMNAWAENQGVADDKFITMMGDPSGAATAALGMVLDHPGPMSKFKLPRCKRFAMFVDDGMVKVLKVAEGPGPMGEEDPAGDDFPEATLPPSMLKEIKKVLGKDEL